MARQLRSHWRSIPLHRLTQGCTLTFASSIPVNVTFVPEWRDSGHLDLRETLPSSRLAEVKVQQLTDCVTSMGRTAPHVSIAIHEADESTDPVDESLASPVPPDGASSSVKTDRIILDDGTIHPDSELYSPPPKGTRRVEYHDGVAHITNDEDNSASVADADASVTEVTIQHPEKLNLDCNLSAGGSITIQGKMEGDAKLVTSNGKVCVKKLRGYEIDIQNNDKPVFVSEVLEAIKVNVETKGRFRAKQVYGTNVNVSVHGDASCDDIYDENDDGGSAVDISALFVSGQGGATIRTEGRHNPTRRLARIKSHHGPIRVQTLRCGIPQNCNPHTGQTYPMMELGGVNGQFEALIDDCQSEPDAVEDGYKSCLVHIDSLSPESVSLATTCVGDIGLTVDRKVEADLRLLSNPAVDSMEESIALLADEQDDEMVAQVLSHLPVDEDMVPDRVPNRITVTTKAFTRRDTTFSHDTIEYVDGYVENRSAEPDSRFERKVRGDAGSVGKIRIDGAADQALDRFGDATDASNEHHRPLLAAMGPRGISVESVSWLGAIARRYGLDEDDRTLGRTASRRGRSFASETPDKV